MKRLPPSYQRFLAELKRRHVFRMIAVYGAVAFAVIEAADIVFPRMALPDWTVTFVVWVSLLGFPVAVALSWAFDLTPQGMQRTVEATPEELNRIIAAPAPKRWPAGLLALAGMIALLAGAWYAGRQSSPSPGADQDRGPSSPSVAVLPFADMSPEGDQEYFADGISEELLNLLTRIPELRVAARTSSFSYKGTDAKIGDVGRELNVGHVLEGSVRKAGNRVRITAQLIETEDGFHLWSDTWDRNLDDIFALQDEIATEVAERLRVTLMGATLAGKTTNPAAYALYLEARHLGRQITPESLDRALGLYQEALIVDPDYAAAWAGLAAVYFTQASIGLRPVSDGFQLATEAARRALAIDPDHAPAHARLGGIAKARDGDLATAARHYERALVLAPNDPAILLAATGLLQELGRVDEAIAITEGLIARDPVNPVSQYSLCVSYLYAGRYDDAIASCRAVLTLSPGSIGVNFQIGAALLLKGEPQAALERVAQEEGDEEYRVKGTALALHDLGRHAEYEAALGELTERWGNQWPSEIAQVHAWAGDADLAFEWLDKAVAQNEDGLTVQFLLPFYAPLHDDPRWKAFRERTGTSEAHLAAIRFETRLPR